MIDTLIYVMEAPLYRGKEIWKPKISEVYVCDVDEFSKLEKALNIVKPPIRPSVRFDPVPADGTAERVTRNIERAICPFAKTDLFNVIKTPDFLCFKADLEQGYLAILKEYLKLA